MFKKVVIADSLASIVDEIFSNYQNHNGITLIIGIVGFAFQVYGDFSGYTDVARGISKLLGIELILNFNFPYFSRSIPEFWSRWHISLSSWLNDYVFTPIALNFRQHGKLGIFIAIFITFIISGFWHGAGLNYIAWGAYYGILYLPFVFSKKGIKSMVNKKYDTIKIRDLPKILLTFSLICLGYVLFRAPNLHFASNYIKRTIFSIWGNPSEIFEIPSGKIAFIYIILLLFGDWHFQKNNHPPKNVIYSILTFLIYSSVVTIILYYIIFSAPSSFVYFQF
jgi:D-alanyl-lipoteichoic acid acyltransferase DltB (MBOAT superfamily)